MCDRYENGKIYKLVNDVSDDVYYGCTCMPLSKRLYWYKTMHYNYIHRNDVPDRGIATYFISAFQLFDLDSPVHIVLVEEYTCDNREQLFARLRHYVDLNDCLNKKKLSDKELIELLEKKRKESYLRNRDKTLEKKLVNYYFNRESILEKRKKKIYCPCGSTLSVAHLSKHKKTLIHKTHEAQVKTMFEITLQQIKQTNSLIKQFNSVLRNK